MPEESVKSGVVFTVIGRLTCALYVPLVALIVAEPEVVAVAAAVKFRMTSLLVLLLKMGCATVIPACNPVRGVSLLRPDKPRQVGPGRDEAWPSAGEQ